MPSVTAIIVRDTNRKGFVGFVPGWPGAHSQGETLDELHVNLREVIAMLASDGPPPFDAEFVGTLMVASS